jgi:hypothetical protein
VAAGASFTAAAHTVGRRNGDAVARLVACFSREGLAAVTPRYGGGPPVQYGAAERARILAEFHRPPDREQDGTATWSLTTLQRALRRAPDGLPTVSTARSMAVLWEAGYTWQRMRTWCHTGTARRQRRAGTIEPVHDPLAAPKKRNRARLSRRGSAGAAGVVPGRSRALSGNPPTGGLLALGGRSRSAASRVRPRRHRQAAYLVPARDRRGAGSRSTARPTRSSTRGCGANGPPSWPPVRPRRRRRGQASAGKIGW